MVSVGAKDTSSNGQSLSPLIVYFIVYTSKIILRHIQKKSSVNIIVVFDSYFPFNH